MICSHCQAPLKFARSLITPKGTLLYCESKKPCRKAYDTMLKYIQSKAPVAK